MHRSVFKRQISTSFLLCLQLVSLGIGMIFIHGCEDNDTPTIVNEKEIESVKNLLREAESQNDLITRIELTSDSTAFILFFEKRDSVRIGGEVVTAISERSDAWEAVIEFSDGSQFTSPLLGTTWPILAKDVQLNPFDRTPLAARVSFSTPVPGNISVVVLGQDGSASDITHTFDTIATDHVLTILGLYADHLNTIDFIFTNEDGLLRASQTIQIQTEPLPDDLPAFDILIPYTSPIPNEVFWINFMPSHAPVLVDAFGKVRWYGTGDFRVQKRGFQRLANGNIVFGAEEESMIFEYTMLGAQLNQWSVLPEFEDIHHDVYELPNGNFIVTVNKVGAPTIEDYLVEVDRQTGDINTIWDLNEVLPKRYTFFDDPVDWVHVNAVVYDESDNSLIVSGQRQGLFKISWKNELKWILAPPEGWGDFSQYLLQPISGLETFEPIWGQHAPKILPNGNILLFDNGFGRGYGQGGKYSRIVEFDIDEADIGGTVAQIWSYGKSRGEELFAPIMSDVDYLIGSDSRLMIAGSLAFDHTYVDSANIQNSWSADMDKARIIDIAEDQTVLFEMLIQSPISNGAVYRAESLSIYPE